MKNTYRYKWLIVPIMYLVICVWTYFGSTLIIDGVEAPRHEAGMWGLIGLHVMVLLATIGAYVLHWVMEALTWIWTKLFK
jgi:hypothetical protein